MTHDWSDGVPVHTSVHRDDKIILRGADWLALKRRLRDAESRAWVAEQTLKRLTGSREVEG
jgi:hypothetical protein